ncbi:MAG: NAD(P)H-binding protein [Actinobacteria bacterium]|nr:NAD(P)H-binding protein [Actinomycetota bacterium]
MARIVELSPVFADAGSTDHLYVNGIWNARQPTEDLARQRGHSYLRPPGGGVSTDAWRALLAGADAVILAPTTAGPGGMQQPADGEEAGRIIGQRLLDGLRASRLGVHVVLVSHFLVGHGRSHRNAKASTWSLHALEAHLRGGQNPWTILRPTWLSTIHDPSYQTRLSPDRYADGLVSTESVAAAVVTAIEHPEVSAGRTAAIFSLSIPETGHTDLAAQFAAIEPDLEAGRAVVSS